ncbi:MAG: hypothetical protein COU81_01440 [Candidatus Portnoybacteria bacterium CG10_big_fil_rev_8_21_14_0_10_36_7]|uniref:Uncharacterized protein n=1 Tax=Candidatus Portnoybacteria bacterium CG10_big_fil_rev_8_21_14_0_10_36_7 TaxID=1974812 RepID=A0A2M8KEF0_9BACT|nr:MAG: hypothetical protein COU81_01440 [Candidatus Portnoybacteria bacterium CG10_big_fil_rev_8_21_14_0_10_36_7]
MAKELDNEKKDTDDSSEAPAAQKKRIGTLEFFFIFLIGIVNDALDYVGLALETASLGTTIPYITAILKLIDLATSFILGAWCYMRLNQFPSTRFGISFLIELIPGLGEFSPTWSLFVLSEFIKQRSKLGEAILGAAEFKSKKKTN